MMSDLEMTAAAAAADQQEDRIGLEQYYSEAGPDYAAWSAEYNMHFGYYSWGMNPLDREAMLESMNGEVLRRLQLDARVAVQVLDMGCGLGATLRSFSRRLPRAEMTGITLVPWQIERGTQMNQACDGGERIDLIEGDYERVPLPGGTMDGAYALESSCHAHGAAKGSLLCEAYRVLRPGGRFVMTDGFLEHGGAMAGWQSRIYDKLCECWVIEQLGVVDEVVREMERIGFRNVQVERLQFRVAPSVFHIPWVTAKFLLTDVVFGKRKMTRARWNNMIAPALLPLVSWPAGPMIYCMVTGTKGELVEKRPRGSQEGR